MKKNIKCYVVLILTVTMVMIFSIPSTADSLGQGSEVGIGEIEGSVKTDIYQVVLPTNTAGVFDFILDPQGLINKTNGAAYGEKKFEADSTVFFERTDDETELNYSNKSDFVTITNKSSIAVDISLHVSVKHSSIKGIVLTEDKEFTDDTDASIYLAIIDGENEVPIGKEGVTIDVTVDAAPEMAYEYIYDAESNEYDYKLNNDLSGIVFDQYSFQLTGAANGKGDWGELLDEKPEVTVAWEITPSKE